MVVADNFGMGGHFVGEVNGEKQQEADMGWRGLRCAVRMGGVKGGPLGNCLKKGISLPTL
jgi:hypothetical protein